MGDGRSGTHLDTHPCHTVTHRLKSLIALWFVLQIVLPFTAPLHTCDLKDLLGTQKRDAPASPDSSTTPPAPIESDSEANSFVSPLAVSTLSASTAITVTCDVATGELFTITFAAPSSPQIQQTVLRL